MTEQLDPETEEKQNYLRDNILDKGYDVNDFIAYLIDKKGEGGDDIANWSLPDLKAIVNEYISHKEQEKMENKIQDNGENKEEHLQNDDKNIILDKNEPPENNENTENIQNEIQQSKTTYGVTDLKEIECQKLELSTLGKTENLSISITGFEKVEGKLFAKSYTVYIIKTSPLNLVVKRRFSDFEWLRQIIVNCYNYCSIPGIPRKTKMADKFSEAFIRKRARTFEKFLSYLVIHPVLKNLKVVYEFLSIEKDSDFSKMKKSY
jgi:sorting nexin-7/30/sorting nexin-8